MNLGNIELSLNLYDSNIGRDVAFRKPKFYCGFHLILQSHTPKTCLHQLIASFWTYGECLVYLSYRSMEKIINQWTKWYDLSVWCSQGLRLFKVFYQPYVKTCRAIKSLQLSCFLQALSNWSGLDYFKANFGCHP